MDSKQGRRASGFRIAAVCLLLLHAFHAFAQGGGGWQVRHGGLGGAVRRFFTLSFGDPVLSAGLSDFGTVAGLLGYWMYTDLPADRRRQPRTFIWLAVYTVVPGLGAVLYPLWINPGHRLVSGNASH